MILMILVKNPNGTLDVKKKNTKLDADGLQFISVQRSPEQNSLDGFWMLKDIGEI